MSITYSPDNAHKPLGVTSAQSDAILDLVEPGSSVHVDASSCLRFVTINSGEGECFTVDSQGSVTGWDIIA